MKLPITGLLWLCLSLAAQAQPVLTTPTSKPSQRMTTTQNPDAVNAQQEFNRQLVDKFFIALETGQFDLLNKVFAENGRQLNPYVPEGFPKSFDGRAAIHKQYSSLPKQFSSMKFPRTIYATEDPNVFFVQFVGDINIIGGGRYENHYVGIFKLRDGQVVEYTEHFNPIVMAKAFGIKLDGAK